MTDQTITALSFNPLVAVVDNVFDETMANHIIGLGDGALERAPILEGALRKTSDIRTNSQAYIDQWADEITTDLVTRISALVRLPPENCERTKLLHYQPDQAFKQHHDGFSLADGHYEQLLNGGQRLFTTLCYLNDVNDGGETEFPKLRIAVRPKLGRVLVFANTLPGDDEPHPHALHIGQPFRGKGEKWVLSLWWRARLYHVPREYPEEIRDMQFI